MSGKRRKGKRERVSPGTSEINMLQPNDVNSNQWMEAIRWKMNNFYCRLLARGNTHGEIHLIIVVDEANIILN